VVLFWIAIGEPTAKFRLTLIELPETSMDLSYPSQPASQPASQDRPPTPTYPVIPYQESSINLPISNQEARIDIKIDIRLFVGNM
jgi:hypothetical protein